MGTRIRPTHRRIQGCRRFLLIVLLAAVMSGRTAWGQVAEDPPVACADCHEGEARQWAGSVHAAAGIDCRTCHGGPAGYPVAPALIDQLRRWAAGPRTSTSPVGAVRFDHGPGFQGKPARRDIPERCGTCHADVARMNPYGLPTDQWAQYRISGHGRALFERHDDRVAVCTDCHGTHEILKPKDPASRVHPKNVPGTCGRCHSDPSVMGDSHLSMNVVEEYRQSVHGQRLLEQGDLGMPHCAGCHGSHSAVPPGFRDVGHVCGRCHQQEEQYFLESPHAKFPLFPRCVACHTRGEDLRDHRITLVATSPEAMKKTYKTLLQVMPAGSRDGPELEAAYAARREPKASPFEDLCQRCHTATGQVGHRMFFAELDDKAVEMGAELHRLVRHAELRYAATAHRVDEVGRGVLVVRDEALGVEEMRTRLVALAGLQHTLNPEKVRETVAELDAAADRTNQSLDQKLKGLRWRHWGLVPMWLFLAVFVRALWAKYEQLKAAMVAPSP